MASEAVTAFCVLDQDLKALKRRRQEECKAASETRRAAEKVLMDSLEGTGAARACVDGESYIVRAKVKLSHPPSTSAVVEKVKALWADLGALRAGVLGNDGGDVAECLARHVAQSVMEEPRERRSLEILPLKSSSALEELPDAAPGIQNLVRSYVVAKEEMAKGQEEFKEERKELAERQEQLEAGLIDELRQTPAKIRTVSLVDAASGLEASFYLRVKAPRTPTKKKISSKILAKSLRELTEEALVGVPLAAGVDVVCSSSFCERLCAALTGALREHEASGEVGPPRVALDRIRTSRAS